MSNRKSSIDDPEPTKQITSPVNKEPLLFKANSPSFRVHKTLLSGSKKLRLNCKKLPEDFFGGSDKNSRKNTALTSRKSSRMENEISNFENGLPQAEVTSFFKMVDVSSSTVAVSPEPNEKYLSEKKPSKKSSNILNEIYYHENSMKLGSLEMDYTFSKKLNVKEWEKEERERSYQKVKSVQIRNKAKMPPLPIFVKNTFSSKESRRESLKIKLPNIKIHD